MNSNKSISIFFIRVTNLINITGIYMAFCFCMFNWLFILLQIDLSDDDDMIENTESDVDDNFSSATGGLVDDNDDDAGSNHGSAPIGEERTAASQTNKELSVEVSPLPIDLFSSKECIIWYDFQQQFLDTILQSIIKMFVSTVLLFIVKENGHQNDKRKSTKDQKIKCLTGNYIHNKNNNINMY